MKNHAFPSTPSEISNDMSLDEIKITLTTPKPAIFQQNISSIAISQAKNVSSNNKISNFTIKISLIETIFLKIMTFPCLKSNSLVYYEKRKNSTDKITLRWMGGVINGK